MNSNYYIKLSALIRENIFDFLDETRAVHGKDKHIEKLYGAIEDFLSRESKMIRSILLILSWQAYSSDSIEKVIPAAAGLELLHACALIHDDIVDKADCRRGGKAMHLLLNKVSGKRDSQKGKDLAIVAGDILYGMGLKLFMEAGANPSLKCLAADEVMKAAFLTGIGEFSELVYESEKIEDLNREDILKIYDYKSARYTFACPMLAGAILAGAPENDREEIFTGGRLMGTAFQIRDDIIDITENIKGREPYEDLMSKKKTMLMHYTYVSGYSGAKEGVRKFLSLENPSVEDCRNMVRLYIKSGSIERAEKEIKDLSGKAKEILSSIMPDKNRYGTVISFCRSFL